MNTYAKPKFMLQSPLNQSDMFSMQGPAIIQNHLIVNINENKNINNFYNVIQGRKMNEEQNIIRMGRNETETNSKDLLAKFKEGIDDTQKTSYKTMISKKLLNQAKQMKKKEQMGTSKQNNNHNTTASLINRHIDSKFNKTPVANQTTKDLHHNANYQTQRHDRKKNKTQFDFDQNLSKLKNGKENKVTLDLDHNNELASGPQDRSTILGMSKDSERRRNSQIQHTIQGKSSNRTKQNYQTVKSSRPLANAKKSNSISRHKRFKSDLKNGIKSQQNNLTQLVKQTSNIEKRRNTQTKTSRAKHNSTFENDEFKRAKMNSQFQNTKRQKASNKRDEGISLSSGFSSASRSRFLDQNDISTREGQSHLYESKQLAQQLNKTYFLNTKQLLRHLSPKKDMKLEGSEQQTGNRKIIHKQSISQCGGKDGTLVQDLSQRKTTTFRGRSKSTTNNFMNQTATGTIDKRRNNSCSEQRQKSRDARQVKQNVVSRGDNQDPLHVSSISKSLTLGTSATPAANSNSLGTNGKAFKHKVDKLIKQNIRKNQSKIEESLIKKQMEEFKQQQRKNNLSQRNKELRIINASKVVTSNQKDQFNMQNISVDNKSAEIKNMDLPRNRARSQSCVDYKSAKGKTMDSNRKANRSQERDREFDSANQSKIQPHVPPKQVPLTTTNQTTLKQNKQRSFVDEITKLTQQVERELGIQSSHQGKLNSNNVPQQKQQNQMKFYPDSLNDQDISSLTYKQQSSAQDRITTKRQKKKDKMSVKVQKFIEKKKREDLIKKSLERTIEVEKQQKIKQNLKNLDKFVQQHLRQKSQPMIPGTAKKMIVNGTLLGGEKKVKKIHKKNKKTQDQTIVGLSEIFYPDFPENSNPDFTKETILMDQTAKQISQDRMMSQQNSLLDYTEQNTVILTAGRANKNKKPTSSSKTKKTKKTFNLDKTKDTTGGARTASGSAVTTGHFRKASVPIGFGHNKRSSLNPDKQMSVPIPMAQLTSEDQNAVMNNMTQPIINSKQFYVNDKSKWLEQKHPDIPDKQNNNGKMNKIPTQSDFNQTTQLILTNIDVSNNDKIRNDQKRQKQNTRMRKSQDLVQLYRCKFKPNVSDASIIGTLHSAASVIQIHFRYRKQLKEQMKMINQKPKIVSNQVSSKQHTRKLVPDTSSKRRSDKKSTKRSDQQKFQSIPESDSLRVIRENLEFHENYEGILNDVNESAAFKDVRASVFGASELDEIQQQPEIVDQEAEELILQSIKEKEIGPKDLKFKKEKVLIPQKNQDQKVVAKTQDLREDRKQNKLQLLLDVDQITNEQITHTQQSAEINEHNQLLVGNKTPKIPLLNIDQLNKKEKKTIEFQPPQEKVVDDPYGNLTGNKGQGSNDYESNYSQHTVSSYRGLFNRAGLPLPRSARVKVDYDLVQKDPKITEQLQEIVNFKESRGRQVLKDGKKDNLISEQAYQINLKKLERWVSSNHRKIQDIQQNVRKIKKKTSDQLLQESVEGRERLNKLMQNSNFDIESSRMQSMSQSWRASNINKQNDNNQSMPILENISSKRLSDAILPKHKEDNQNIEILDEVESIKLEDIQISQIENVPANNTPLDLEILEVDKKSSRKDLIQTEKSMNRSISYPTIKNKDSGQGIDRSEDEMKSKGMKSVDPSEIELQLEDALENQKKKQDSLQSPSKDEKSLSHNMEDIRDPRFFMSKVEDEQGEDARDFPDAEPIITFPRRVAIEQQQPNEIEISSENQLAPSPAEEDLQQPLSPEAQNQVALLFGSSSDQGAIKVENQQPEPQLIQHESSLGETANQTRIITHPSSQSNEPQPIIASPLSDGQSFEFCKIQTGAHSLSSTDSEMAKAIKEVNKNYLDSPPNLISPKADQQINMQPFENNKQEQKSDKEKMGDEITDLLLNHLLRELKEEIPILAQRPQLVQQQRQGPTIKFFDKKGIKTDLFAIEKYVDEILKEVMTIRPQFMDEVNKPQTKDPLQNLFQMQNSEIGSYEHFQTQNSSVLNLDLYLNLEKRRKESRENPASQHHASENPDGLFDFDKVNDSELREEGVDRNFLAEQQHIHNKVLFDCINESLQQFRPHGKEGAPQLWSTAGRKLKPTEDFTLEEMFEITKHDLFRMAIVQAGTLPRREFVFNHAFDEELFAEIREKKLATLLCREIVETEPSWLKWDFEEAQTKIDISDMVLEALVTETIEFLNTKNPKSYSQMNFESIQEGIRQL